MICVSHDMCFCYEGVVCFVDGIYNLSIKFCIGVVEKLSEGLSEISFSLRRFKQRLEVIQAIYMTNASKRGDYLRQSKLCISFNELRKENGFLTKRVRCIFNYFISCIYLHILSLVQRFYLVCFLLVLPKYVV